MATTSPCGTRLTRHIITLTFADYFLRCAARHGAERELETSNSIELRRQYDTNANSIEREHRIQWRWSRLSDMNQTSI